MSKLVRRVKIIEPVKKVLDNSSVGHDWEEYVIIACELDNYLKEKGVEVGDQERSLLDEACHEICDPFFSSKFKGEGAPSWEAPGP